jgi:hypothetical protein
MEALEEQSLVCAAETAEQSQFCQHRAIAAGEIGQERCLLQDVTTDDAEHVSPPAGARQHVPKPIDGNRRVAYARDVRPIPPLTCRIDKASCLLFEGEQLAFFVDEGRTGMSQDDIRILFEQPDARVQVGLHGRGRRGQPI